MRKIFIYFILITTIPLLVINCVEKTDEPVEWEYNPEKAGVKVFANIQTSLNESDLPMYPKLSKDGNFVYIFILNQSSYAK